ncbi:MAG: acylphosphatase [bacterium]|nr:acylphosphatase [bacterium]
MTEQGDTYKDTHNRSNRDFARFRAIIHGKVHGVSFGYQTQRRAVELGVDGWVRNLDDGTVEIDAEGEHPSLDTLVGFLQQGPTGADVTRVDLNWLEPLRADGGFSIQY